MVGKFTGFRFTEHILEVMIVFGNGAQIDRNIRSGRRVATGLGRGDVKLETLGALEFDCMGVSCCIDKGNSL